MSINKAKQEFANEKIEFKTNKVLVFIAKFWRFSKFYGEYLGSMHSSSRKQLKHEKRKHNE